jgi:two-component system phosphate regulon sensor histidine kinase PhoR
LLVLILVSIGVLGFYLVSSLRNAQLDNMRSQLESQARLIAHASLPIASASTGQAELDSLAKTLGEQTDARITIIAPDGTILGDSHEDPLSMETHAARPEVVAALTSGLGESTRYSITLGLRMMYVAVPIVDQDTVLGIARVALPLTQVDSSVNRTTTTVITGMTVAGLLVILATAFITGATNRRLKQMTKAIRSISPDVIGLEGSIETDDESQLARTFSEMSQRLKNMLDTVSKERSRLTTVLSSMTDGVIMTDAERKVLLSNHAAARLLGFREDKAVGQSLIELIHDHEIDDLLRSCLNDGEGKATQLEAGPDRKFLRAITIPLGTDRSGGALLLFQDLTELRNLQTMRREFVGNISHELRTPLATIKAIVETLQDGAVEERAVAKDFLARADSEVDRMTQMVAELTELSHIETGKAELRLEPVDLNSVIESSTVRLAPQAERQNVSLIMKPETKLPAVQADRDRIGQVITNLVHNAIKFTPAGGRVTISTKSEKGSVTVKVTDNGTGIAKDDLPRIFERFYKADKARSGEGTGMGLAITRHVVEAHGGRIWAESEEGKGSTFGFSLPGTIGS